MFHSRLERTHAPFETSLASKISKNIEHDVQKKSREGRHLSSTATNANDKTAQFYRKELKYGRLLGCGAFCEVHVLQALVPNSRYDNASKAKSYQPNRKNMTAIVKKSRKSLFVVKHLRPSLLKDQRDFHEAAVELILEAKYLTTLKHPNLISMHASATAGAMSYADGHHDAFFVVLDRLESTLIDKMFKWKMQGSKLQVSIDKRVKMMVDLAGALEFLHDRRLVYRDLKPGNVGFDLNGNVRLFDFGLLAELPKEGYLKQRSGTVRYMAPDCFMGKYDCKADVYSLTVLLWEILTLKQYFDNMENLDHVKATMNGTREALDDSLPIGIRAVINQGWIGDPNKRPSMRDFRNLMCGEIGKMTPSHHKQSTRKGGKPITESSTFETVETALSDNNQVSLYDSYDHAIEV